MPPIKNNFVYVSNMNMTQLKKIAEKEVESKDTKTVQEAGIEASKNIYGEE